MPVRDAGTLRDVMFEILVGVGTPEQTASFVGDSLVDANLAGHDSHGVIRLLHYVQMQKDGKVDPQAVATVASKSGATAVIEGAWGWGQPAMWLATQQAIELAREFGLGAAAVRNCYHIGRVAPYVEAIAAEKMIGIALSNAGRNVTPYGGRRKVMGTNPFAWAAPRENGLAPICLDIATASIAEGKVRVARSKGELVPEGMIVNSEGLPTRSPDEFYDGGALLPFGGHKGSGISLLAQILGRGISGMLPDMLAEHRGANGPFVLAIDIGRFGPLATFFEAVESTADEVHGTPPAEGFDRVLLPGEPELETRKKRGAEGIPVPDTTWNELTALAKELAVYREEWDR
jgi:uncharacterized oxidoreductase